MNTLSDVLQIDDEIVHRIMNQLEGAKSRDLAHADYAKIILDQIESVSSGVECELEKRAVIKVLLASTWSQRLYFIIRSFIMGQIGALITLGYIFYFGSIDFIGGFIMGMVVFVASLSISSLFDEQIIRGTKKIVGYLGRHGGVRDFIMKYF